MDIKNGGNFMENLYKKISIEAEKKFPNRKIVFGDGDINSDIMLIGEAPGGDEEKQGKPFVGKAGKNLNEFLKSINLERSKLYVSNVVKLRPFKLSPKTNKPINRPPDKTELEFFTPFLMEEIKILNPKLIVTLGNTPLRAVLDDKNASIGDYHGKITKKGNINLFALYHPASIIYNQSLKEVYADDVKVLAEYISNIK